MRVIAGTARSLPLKTPEGMDTRPTTDRIKETLFNMLQTKVGGSVFVDLFSGSGGIGIEALSRGAKRAVFVDKNAEALSVTKQNLTATRLMDNAKLVQSDSIVFLQNTNDVFDIILIDPPYQAQLYERVLQEIWERKLLSPNGIIVVEFSENDPPEIPIRLFSEVREKKYGKVKIFLIKA